MWSLNVTGWIGIAIFWKYQMLPNTQFSIICISQLDLIFLYSIKIDYFVKKKKKKKKEEISDPARISRLKVFKVLKKKLHL